jgi:hypothetical protein
MVPLVELGVAEPPPVVDATLMTDWGREGVVEVVDLADTGRDVGREGPPPPPPFPAPPSLVAVPFVGRFWYKR